MYIKNMKKINLYVNEAFKLRDNTKLKEIKDPILSKITFIEEDETIEDYFNKCDSRDITSEIDDVVRSYLRDSDVVRLTEHEWKIYNELSKMLDNYTLYDCEEDDSIYEIADKLPELKNNYKCLFWEWDGKINISYYFSDNCIIIMVYDDVTTSDHIKYFFGIKK